MNKIIIFLIGYFLFQNCTAQYIDLARIKKDIEYLSSDKLEGRYPGTKGGKKAAKYIARQFEKTKLQPMGSLYFFQDFPFKYNPNPHDTSDNGAIRGKTANVVGFLNNKAEYTIVIGAHYDHLGLGHGGNSLDANPKDKIHNGADDNASGTAGVMELARYFSDNNRIEPYNFLFICFSGEEEGLLGSKFFSNNPTFPLGKINCMINMDMIGRLNDSTSRIIVYGTGTSPVFEPILNKLANEKIKVKQDSSGMGPSDHSSFYLKNIPVLHFFTGTHTDYHKPSDDAHKINYAGEKEVLEFMVKVINEIGKEPKLTFLQTRNPQTQGSSFKVTLGIIPDYSFEGKGLRMDGVSEGKPAQKAGLQGGDVIIGIDDQEIKDMSSYMKVLSEHKKGDTVKIRYIRNGINLSTEATF